MHHRREFLRDMGAGGLVLALLSSGLLKVPEAWAAGVRNQVAFDAKSIDEAFGALGASAPVESADIALVVPEIAENGAVVPISVSSTIAGADMIALLVEQNPNPLAAVTSFPAGTEANVSSRVKMQQTSNVVALVRANGQFFKATKPVKVTLGGCGG